MKKEEDTGREKIIFLGNGPLAEHALAVLEKAFEIIFIAHTKEDLARVVELKREFPETKAVLASFGVLIPSSVLGTFEPEGILNIHPSLLPKYRGASPIESAILAGETDFSVSVMKLVKEMDAGPVYYQTALSELPLDKLAIYKALAEAGAEWIADNLKNLPEPVEQTGEPTFTGKMTKTMGLLMPETDTAETTFQKIVAYQGFPKPKTTLFGVPCIVLEAHILKPGETAPLFLECKDGVLVALDKVQPEGRKAMDAKSFLNGYKK